ncbi:MAG: helix-turn-helix transcriptional regulator [Ardenticatenaceae bacterium]|nr:helix-turn-helix transcriptional regulator [Ardenticatenaceae bacterium]
MKTFGELLKFYREQCTDSAIGKGKLTQARLGELIGREVGFEGYTGGAVSEWERGKSHINKDDRLILKALIRILHENGGLVHAKEADEFLISGNYAPLNFIEMNKIFMQENEDDKLDFLSEWLKLWPPQIGKLFGSEFPFRWLTPFQSNLLTSKRILQGITWLLVWIITWFLVTPLMQWPFYTEDQLWQAIVFYVSGSFIVPLIIAALTITKNDPFWQKADLSSTVWLRLYTHQGALVGFHVGYMLIFFIRLVSYCLRLDVFWAGLNSAAIAVVISLSYMTAKLTPSTLYDTYGRLNFRDGAIFWVSIFFGVGFGVFFFIYHAYILYRPFGLVLIAAAVFLLSQMSKPLEKQNTK